jgi:hypothetical protein
VAAGLGAQPWPFLSVGSRVYLERGPLAGLEGIVTSDDKIDRVVVSVSLLQRSVAVEIDRSWARRVSNSSSSADCGQWRIGSEAQLATLALSNERTRRLDRTADSAA